MSQRTIAFNPYMGYSTNHVLPLADKIAIVTGGSRGIGAAVVEQLASLGARVVVNYNKSFKDAEKIVNKMKSKGGQVCCLPGNVADEGHMERITELTRERFGKVDILVNNAGVTRDSLLDKMDSKAWHEVIEVNLSSVYNCTHAVLPSMIEQKSGCIINISSIIGQSGGIGQANYAAAKSGIIGFTKSAALEMAKYNIRVNAVCPGFIETSMTDAIPENIKDKITKKIPLGRFGDCDEIAKTVTFLITTGTYITGQAINVNGGMYM